MVKIRIEDLDTNDAEMGDTKIAGAQTHYRHPVNQYGEKRLQPSGPNSCRRNSLHTYFEEFRRLNLN